MAEIQKLLEVLSSPADLLAEIRSGAVIPGLDKLYGVIDYAVSDVGDGKLGFQDWEESRFEAVVSIIEVLASAVSTFPVEKPLYIVARVLKLSLELCVLYLEKSELGSHSSKIQKRVLQVVENVLHVGSSPTSSLFNLSYLVELLSNGPANSVKRESLWDSECIGGGLDCLVETKAADRCFVAVGPQSSSLAHLRISPSTEGLIFGDQKTMASHVQHWAVVHLGCICRLLDICNKGLLSLPKDLEWNGAPLLSRLTLIVRILRLLNNLAKETELVPSDAKLLPLVACVADGLSSLFRLNIDLHDIAISDHSAAEDTLDYLAVRLLEEYFGFLQVVFPDGLVLKNIQTCLLANVLSILEPEIWRYDKHVDCQRLPLVYAPRIIMHLLKLFGEVRGLSGQLYVWSRSIGMDLLCGSLSETSAPVCHTPTKNVALLEKHSYDECLDVVFPASGNWLDNLIHLAGFFYTEGIKLRPKLEKTLQNCPKSSSMSEVDPGASNEDEALFGDLFSEPNRQLGIAEVSDQARVSTKLNFNLFLQANIELLVFLKDFIFAPEWNSAPSKDACVKLTLDHIGLLMPMLLYQGNQAKDGDHESDLILAFEKQLEQISDLCFYLLRCLLCHHIFPGELEDDLVDVILKVQNGTFIYSSFSLTLLGHALISRVGDVGCALRKRIFMQYIGYMMEKSKLAYDEHITLEEVAKSMPCPFHIEILLMAFHLSADPEKATLANLLSSALNSLDDPPDHFTAQQRTVWTFIISRLLLLVHHMIFYPSRCPSWLFLCVRSKLSRTTLKGYSFDSSDCHLLSWPLIVFRTMLDEPYTEHPLGRIFNSQLFDTVPFPLPSRIDGPNLKWPLDLLRKRILRIVDLWSHKVADKVEQLILERYCFVICWDTLRCLPYSGKSELVLQSLDINNLDDLFFFSHLLVEDVDVLGSLDVSSLKECVMSMLLQLQNALSRSSDVLLGLKFFRYHSWLSLLLSFLDAGARQICSQNQITGAESLAVSPTQVETISSLSVNLITSLIKDGRIGWLLRTLFTLLVDTVEVLQEAFIRSLDCEQDALSKFSPLLLLKHRGLTKDMHDELLSRLRVKPEMLDYVCSVLPKVDHLIAKENGLAKQMVLRSMLHGFPSYCEGSTAVYLSCILSVESIIVTIEGLLQLGYDVTDTSTDVWRLLGTLSTVKMDKSFQKISGSCEAIWRHICPSNEWKDCDEILVLKHIEGFLKEVGLDSKEGHNSYIIETLIGSAVDIIRHLIKDPANFDTLKFYAGGKGGVSKQTKELNCNYCVDLLMFMDSLDNSLDELVNVKVLKLYLDLMSGGLCPGVKEELLQKFLKMNSQSLSDWLGKRILGCPVEGPEGNVSLKSSSLQLLEVTMNFILNLVPGFSHVELQNKLIDSMLIIIERAFSFCDLQTIKSYFSFIVQLAAGGSGFKSLLKKTVMLMEKLSSEEKMLQALRFLFGFFTTVFKAMGANKNYLDHASSKQLLYSSSTAGSTVSRQVSISRKGTETLALPASQETDPGAVDCDEAFLDDDDDDGTSDGELASMDKDDDDDSNSERALASKVCTFTSSGSNFMEQHWYFCYTCDLTVSKGCCSVCAKVCHKGHRVVYSRSSRFFCDCGAGGVRGSSCQCLKPRKFTGSIGPPVKSAAAFNSFLPLSDDADQPPDNDSDVEDVDCLDMENTLKFTIPVEEHEEIKRFLKDLDIENRILELCQQILPSITGRRDSNLLKDQKLVLGEDKVLSYNAETMQLKKVYKSGSFDLKLKMDYSNSRELKTHLSCGSLTKSLVSISSRGRVAAGEGDKVSIFDAGQIIGQPTVGSVAADKANIKPLSKNVVRFEIVHLAFNPSVENYLAVAGYEECQVLTINPRGEVSDRLSVELALQGAYIRHVDWLPGSQVRLMVVTNLFVKIYDLSQDNISPTHYFTLHDDVVVDAVLVAAPKGRMFLLVLSELGKLYRLQLSMQLNSGAKTLTETIHIQDKQLKGMSLYYSRSHRLLFLSYQDGTSLIGQLDSEATVLSKVSFIYEDESDGQLKPAGLHHWKELFEGSGVFVCFSSFKSNALLAIALSPHELASQNLRQAVGSALSLVGIAAYKPLSKDKVHAIALYDDGSLQVYSLPPIGTDIGQNVLSDQVKKLGSCILSRSFMGSNPEFPLDFFERTICITQDVKLSGDAIQNNDSEGTKQTLATEDGFLESPSPSGFKIAVTNLNPDMVMVGCRIHVGNSSASHIPSNVSIFQRVIKLEEGLRSWYDIPFTTAEALLADEEFTITIGPTFNGSVLSRIDSLEIYGRAKDDFGWKDKMDAILNVEAHALSSGTGVVAGKWYRSLQASSIQEQVVAEGLKLLSSYYSLYRVQSNTPSEEIDPASFKCKNLLEVIFSSDRESLLQAAACLVLHVLFPKKETYYQVKDSMRLLGVVSASPSLASRIGAGSVAARSVINEFTTQLQAVSKIALHRRENMAAFLENHGSGLVDGLMEVLWSILDAEQPDNQTINNIVIPSVELIYSYAECLALHGSNISARSVAPAASFLCSLLFARCEAVQTSSSLAISSRLLQVPFPKQTMLATDDVVDGSTTPAASLVANIPGEPTQVMIEEDAAASSVQYCCDGCSTVPILSRRWHCNVCPDFDLCEACYEVMDADRLPPPHSRDHSMSAIPIEIDSFVVDGSEIQFSMDELSSTSLLHVANDVSIQNSHPADHLLELNDANDFPAAADQRVVLISASKRAVNSLLLTELVDQLKGWMETVNGIKALPVMQLFYRLCSAVGGPFMDSSKSENLDLEKFVRWLFEEIHLDRAFPAKARSPFGEVTILIFMFFTLMLRNWHQPGSDVPMPKSSEAADKGPAQGSCTSSVSPSTDEQGKNEFMCQLVRACTALRQQAFINYLLDILEQLVQVFKSPPSNLEASQGLASAVGCGAFLTVRRELPAGNFVPFFSDSYGKAHRVDLFMDYHKLLLENTFRLVYSLIRPEKLDKSIEKDKSHKVPSNKDLRLDGYQDVLCSYINNPHTSFVRRYARRLFLHLCGSKTQYYTVRDSWQMSSEIKKLYKLVNKSGDFHDPVPYERSVKLIKCLTVISEVAAARPRNWQKYCSKHAEVLSDLLKWIFYFGEESAIQALKLLSLAFYFGKEIDHSQQKSEADTGNSSSKASVSQSSDSKKKKKSEDGSESSTDKSFLDMEASIEIFTEGDCSPLKCFIDCFLLEWNSTSTRAEAKNVMYGLWHHGKLSFKEKMLKILLEKVKWLPVYGQNIIEYTELLTWLLGKAVTGNCEKHQEATLITTCLSNDVISCIFETFKSQNELLANHPNSRIYNTLSGLVEFDGYYLESEPCVACSCPEVPYSRMKLEALKSETKFTDNRIIVKCTGSFTIQSVTMNVHDARKSKSVKVLNLYHNNRPVSDLSELKNNWSLWKHSKSCHLSSNQTELKVEFPIPITACNFMIELDSFYENLQASSLESLQCPRCSRNVTDKHGICSNCHENAYQCRQCRNINYENLDSFLCNECGYSKYGRFEFNFMAKPSFIFDSIENDEDMKKALAAIELESENAHKRYQQLLGFKKPLLKLVSSIGDNDMDSQQKDSVQQMMVSLPGPSCKINRKIALLGVLYGEKCKAAFDSVSKSVQTLQGLSRVLMAYLHQKNASPAALSQCAAQKSHKRCYGCATTFVTQSLELLQVLAKQPNCKKQLVSAGVLSELFENNIHQGPKAARIQARAVICAFCEGDINAVTQLNNLIKKKVIYCLEHHRSMDIALVTREELLLLSEACSISDELWEARLRIAFQLFFSSIKLGAQHPAISEHVILPCLRIVSQACTPPKLDSGDQGQIAGKPESASQTKDATSGSASSISTSASGTKIQPVSDKHWDGFKKGQEIRLCSYSEWDKGASYLDFVRRQYKISQTVKAAAHRSRRDSSRLDFLALKYALKWKWHACKGVAKDDLPTFELGSWVSELVLSSCSPSIRSEICTLIGLLYARSTRKLNLLNLLMELLPKTLAAGENAADYFDLLFKMIDSDDARLFLNVKGFLTTICRLITTEVVTIESLENSLHIDISQGFILHKLIELLSKFLEVPNIRTRFMCHDLLSQVLEALVVTRGLVIQKTKLISDCNRLLNDLLDGLLHESRENKRHFIRACVSGLQKHGEQRKGRTSLFILEQLCNLICPSKPEHVYLLILNKAHTQEEFIRGSMTKNPYSSTEIGPLMRDVKNKICHQLELLGLLEDDYGMELLVAGNIISLDLSIAQVYELVWRKSHGQSLNTASNSLSGGNFTPARDCPPMTVTYRLQGLDGEATEPMIKELEEDREECQDPEVEFAIAGAVREFGGLETIVSMIQRQRDDELKSNKEELVSVLNLLMYCCKIRENRRALLRLGALGLLLETARRAFSVDAVEPAEGILLIVESLTMEANETDIGIAESVRAVSSEEAGTGHQAKKIVLMFLERLSHPSGIKMSAKQQRNNEMVARILPYLTYGEQEAMEALVQHFVPYLHDWSDFDRLQKLHQDNPEDESLAQRAAEQKHAVENFVRVSESLKTSSCGERLKSMILDKGITGVAVAHLRSSFAVTVQAGFKSSSEWATAVKLPSVPLILSMLRGLSMGHLGTQKCIDEDGILPLLHALEGVSGENEIGARAENLLDTLAGKEGIIDGFLKDKVLKLRHATRDEMRRLALKKREELLQGLGMRQEISEGGERIVVAQATIEGLEDVEEEEGLACMVCREGYGLRPSDMLGTYSYGKRVNLGSGTSNNGRGECVYTTVSHFNIIHYQCHQEAKRADAALKNPKKEWEGAALRNNETLCNCIFPLRGPSVPLGQYVRCVDQYWDNLNALGRADGSRLRLLTYDIVLMLARFATRASFSTDSKGGGRESNSRLLPFMFQMARHLIDQGGASQRHVLAKSVTNYLNVGPSELKPSALSSSRSSGSEETIQFMMVNSVLAESYQEWLRHRRKFLQRGIYHAYMQHSHGRSSSSLSTSSSSTTMLKIPTNQQDEHGKEVQLQSGEDMFAVVQPMLVYMGLIEQLQQFFKHNRTKTTPTSSVSASTSGNAEESGGGLEEWEVTMKERLMNLKETLNFSKELLSWLEEMQSAADLQEAFDVIGVLGDVLSEGVTQCVDFVKSAIDTGKS